MVRCNGQDAHRIGGAPAGVKSGGVIAPTQVGRRGRVASPNVRSLTERPAIPVHDGRTIRGYRNSRMSQFEDIAMNINATGFWLTLALIVFVGIVLVIDSWLHRWLDRLAELGRWTKR